MQGNVDRKPLSVPLKLHWSSTNGDAEAGQASAGQWGDCPMDASLAARFA
jgi:hypothetical protein